MQTGQNNFRHEKTPQDAPEGLTVAEGRFMQNSRILFMCYVKCFWIELFTQQLYSNFFRRDSNNCPKMDRNSARS